MGVKTKKLCCLLTLIYLVPLKLPVALENNFKQTFKVQRENREMGEELKLLKVFVIFQKFLLNKIFL